MRKFNNKKSVVVVKYAIVGYQVMLGSVFAYGIVRILIALVMGEFNNVSFGIYQ
jgi:hypothetical protein